MSPSIIASLGLNAAEQAAFPVEVAYLESTLQLGRPLRGRELEDALTIYRRSYSNLSALEEKLRPSGQLFMEEWLAAAFRGGQFGLPATEALKFLLLRFAAVGLKGSEIAEFVSAWNGMEHAGIGLASYQQASLVQLRNYLAYLKEFAPYLTVAENQLARVFLLEKEQTLSEELVAQFITRYCPLFLGRFSGRGVSLTNNYTLWADWFSVFSAHELKEEGLPEDYLNTPFAEVIRNVPDRLWFLTMGTKRKSDFIFAVGNPGFYHLAAGNSVRKYLPETGLTRGSWRKLLALPWEVELLDIAEPDLYLWALSLGAEDVLARQVTAFMPRRYQPAWQPVLQQLARLRTINWAAEEGQRLLGYVYHIVRDQPDFRVNVNRPEALLEASLAHYARIEQSMALVAQQRRAVAAADQEARDQQAAIRAERDARRQQEYETWLRKTKWTPLSRAKSFKHPSSHMRILELTNGWELFMEGKAMGHCAAQYARHCELGHFSIWSLRVDRDRKLRSLVTIRIAVTSRQIVEARARFNRVPLDEYKVLINEWAKQNKIKPLSAWE